MKARKMTPSSRVRERNQQASMSAKTKKLVGLYEEEARLRYEAKTAHEYLREVRAFLGWLEVRGVRLSMVRPEDVHAYQSFLYAQRKPNGKPYSSGNLKNRVKALKSFFRFLYRRRYLLHDPAASLDYPRSERRLPRVLLTREEARRILEALKEEEREGIRRHAQAAVPQSRQPEKDW